MDICRCIAGGFALKMSKPTRVLTWFFVALGAVAAVAVLFHQPLLAAFNANPAFNGLILAVFAVGILVNLRQVFRLDREVRWIEAFRRSDPDRAPKDQPVLLRPMAQMLAGRSRGANSLSPASTRSILDTVYLRLEESRDLSRTQARAARPDSSINSCHTHWRQ